MIKVHITTLGCPKNQADSDHLARAFLDEGLVPVQESGDADILLVNTCGFIRDAKEESIEEILRLSQEKKGQQGEERKLLVFGCLSQRYREELLKEIPEIDGLWGVGEERKIVDYCRRADLRKRGSAEEKIRAEARKGRSTEAGRRRGGHSDLPAPSLPGSRASYAYLKIAEGCDKRCTFCVIPSIRGRFRSIPRETVLEEAREYVARGVRELILVAQDITSYGKEYGNYGLAALLRDLAAIEGDFYLRLLYLYPTAITDELIDIVAAEEKIRKYLDIPLQHSEDRLLRLMGRRGTRKEYTKLIRTLRRRVPEVALRTTFIVGFPSETEDEFNHLIDFIEEIRFDRLGVFPFSQEEGTPSATLKGQLPGKTKQRRVDEIMQRQALISLEKNKELVGRRYPAIVDEIDGPVIIARLYSHAPEIDGVVIIETADAQAPGLTVGEVAPVEITGAFDYDLKATIVDEKAPSRKRIPPKGQLRIITPQ